MKKEEIISNLKKLKLKKKDYIIVCGASLVMQGIIEETPDIDLACSKEVYSTINWPVKYLSLDKELKTSGLFDINSNIYDEENIVIIDGYRCMNLEKCLEIKKELNI